MTGPREPVPPVRPTPAPLTARRGRRGLRLGTPLTVLESDPRSAGWVVAVRRILGTDDLSREVDAANQGVVTSVNLAETHATADVSVMGRRHPIQVTATLRAWTDSERLQLVEIVTTRMPLAASLLADEWPEGGAGELVAAGLSPAPQASGDLSVRCACGSTGRCEHAAPALLMLAEHALVKPLEMFSLRGFPSDALLLERVRQQRAISTQGAVVAHPEPRIAGARDAAPPLESQIDQFWTIPAELEPPDDEAPARHASHALLRRLGPSPLKGRFPIVGLLASVYDEVARKVHAELHRIETEQNGAADSPLSEAGSTDRPPPP